MKRFLLLFCLFTNFLLFSQKDTIVYSDLVYAASDRRDLMLDIYKLKKDIKPQLIIWIHGGAWSGGTKTNPPLQILKYGYAMASVDFRLSTEAIFPAQIHDIKAAIRYLKENAFRYGYQANKIVIWGSSSGGHLVATTALTNGMEYYEGNLGEHLHQSSQVDVCIDYFGPTDLTTILQQSTPHGLDVRVPALNKLIGGQPEQAKDLAMKASPVFLVNKKSPPLFIVHGEQDNQVPINQSIELYTEYVRMGRPVQIEYVKDAGHSHPAYLQKEMLEKVDRFIKTKL